MKKLLFVFICLLVSEGYKVNAQKNTTKYSEAFYNATKWRNIGPFRGGRSAAVTGVAGKANLFYFGSTGGGVWKTTDAGNTWENISDGFFGGSVGAVAVSEWDNNVIYVGNGEKTVRGNVSSGDGIWKSVNGGKTWESMGLKNTRHIPRVRIHPKNPDIVYAGVMGDLYKSSQDRGVYKSTNGGKTWSKKLFANENAGVVDLIIDPNNPRVLYATTWNIRRTPYSLSSGGEGSALWKSIDEGETWTNISSHPGLPDGIWGISGVTVSPVNSDIVWALIENKNGGVYKWVHKEETGYDEYVFEPTMFNYTYKIETIDSDLSSDNLVYKEFNFGSHKDKIVLLMDKTWDTSNDKIYYYRLVATCIQKARKEAGLHPWDSIRSFWDGEPKHSLDTPDAIEYIEKITRIKLDNWENNKCDEIYSNYYENTDIKIHLCK